MGGGQGEREGRRKETGEGGGEGVGVEGRKGEGFVNSNSRIFISLRLIPRIFHFIARSENDGSSAMAAPPSGVTEKPRPKPHRDNGTGRPHETERERESASHGYELSIHFRIIN